MSGFFRNMQDHFADCLQSRGFSPEGAQQFVNGQEPSNFIDRILAGPNGSPSFDFSPNNLPVPGEGPDEGYGPDGLWAGVHNMLQNNDFPPGIDAAYGHQSQITGGDLYDGGGVGRNLSGFDGGGGVG